MLHIREAFFIASTPSLVGVPLLGRQLLALVSGEAIPGPVADQISFNQQVYELLARQAGQRMNELAAELQRHQLAVPAPPTDAAGFAPFRDAIIKSVLAAVSAGTPASLAVFVGLHLGEVLLTESLLATALALLTVAPGHPALVQRSRELASWRSQAAAQLAQLVGLASAPPPLRRIGSEIVAAISAAPDLRPEAVDAARAAAVREHHGQLDLLRQSLAAALGPESAPVLLVPAFLLGYLPTATGIPFQCMDLLAQVTRGAPPALLACGQALTERLREGNRETVDNVLAVEALLRHVKLQVPARPQTAAEYFTWLTQIRQAAPNAVQPMSPGGGVMLLGFFLADLLVTLKVGSAALALLDAASDYGPVQAQIAASAKGIASAHQNLEQALRHPTTPEPAHIIGRRLAARVAQAAAADASLPASARLTALETVAAEIVKGKDELVTVLVKAQQLPA